eukprot:9466178-Pyramimonas_sp.AAC.1
MGDTLQLAVLASAAHYVIEESSRRLAAAEGNRAYTHQMCNALLSRGSWPSIWSAVHPNAFKRSHETRQSHPDVTYV